MTKYFHYLLASALLLFSQTALAQDQDVDVNLNVNIDLDLMQCVAAPSLISKIALYGLPLILAGVVGMMISKSWGQKATKRSVDPGPHQTAGWTFGLWLGSLAFAGLLYMTSGFADAEDLSTISGATGCFPAGWGMVAGIFFALTTILFAVTKMNAK